MDYKLTRIMTLLSQCLVLTLTLCWLEVFKYLKSKSLPWLEASKCLIQKWWNLLTHTHTRTQPFLVKDDWLFFSEENGARLPCLWLYKLTLLTINKLLITSRKWWCFCWCASVLQILVHRYTQRLFIHVISPPAWLGKRESENISNLSELLD